MTYFYIIWTCTTLNLPQKYFFVLAPGPKQYFVTVGTFSCSWTLFIFLRNDGVLIGKLFDDRSLSFYNFVWTKFVMLRPYPLKNIPNTPFVQSVYNGFVRTRPCLFSLLSPKLFPSIIIINNRLLCIFRPKRTNAFSKTFKGGCWRPSGTVAVIVAYVAKEKVIGGKCHPKGWTEIVKATGTMPRQSAHRRRSSLAKAMVVLTK